MNDSELLQLLQDAMSRHIAGDLDAAEPVYRRILATSPDHPDALHLLGVLEGQRGRPAEGLPMLQRAAALVPNIGEFHRHLGEVLAMLNRHAEALTALSRAIQLDPRDAAARQDAGASLFAIDRVADAVEQFRIACEIDPNNGAALGNYGHGLTRLGRLDEGIAVLQRATQIVPNDPGPWAQLAEAIWRQGRFEEALAPARRAVELAPDTERTLVILGNVLQTLAKFDEAAATYRRVIEINPNSFDSHNNLALTLLKLGEAQEAKLLYEQMLRCWPDNRDVKANLSLSLLTLGDLDRGFAAYESRWGPQAATRFARFAQSRWDGRDAGGKTILLLSEQGIGDSIHFVRYAAILAERGAKTIVSCPTVLRDLVQTVPGVGQIIGPDDVPPVYDSYATLASLPGLLATTVDTIPAKVPYLRADSDRIALWRTKLANDSGVRVGIVWAGSPTHLNDRSRSCMLADFAPLAAVEGVTFYSLQKGPATEQASSPPAGMELLALGDELHDFSDTAALLECLDLVIAVDTSIVHLAGALARPVWTLLARGPDWRWMLDRDDSPWYPTMRLFRQTQHRAWRPVMDRVADELRLFTDQLPRKRP